MALADERLIHQALFGYADGHRLLETSIRLSSRDLYDLSAVSDLATGVQLRPDESYLTGKMLQDSRNFVLIRTWPAPEMPRPGCVWSHVLVVLPEVLASQRDLGTLNGLFSRPQSRDLGGLYARPLELVHLTTPSGIAPDLVAHVMGSYYMGRPFADSLPVGPPLDSAVLTMWSQQWPRLRATFSFRTARTGSAFGRVGARFDFQPGVQPDHVENLAGAGGEIDAEWIDAAVADAISPDVTPLRRFLWRYGKDVRSSRQRFENLVKIHLATRTLNVNELPLSWAEAIVSLFPGPDNAATLKRDMLGFEPAPLALCPAVAFENTLELLACLLSDGTVVADDALEARLSKARAVAVPALAASLGNHESRFADQIKVIMRALTRVADNRAVSDTRVPPAVRLAIMQSRPDLISYESLATTGDDELIDLLDVIREDSHRAKILGAILRRDMASYPDPLLHNYAPELLLLAVALRSEGSLSHGAASIFRTRAREFISSGALDAIAGSAMAAQAADLLNYPVDQETSNDIARWLSVLERLGVEAEGQSRINFEAYMVVLAVKSWTPAAWDLLRQTLSGLRSVVLAGSLVNPAYAFLDGHLPFDSWNSWDFHKRILIGLRELRRRTGVDHAVVAQLGLSDEDLEFVLEDRKKKREKSKPMFWPWG